MVGHLHVMDAGVILESLLAIKFRQLGAVFRVKGADLGQLLVNGNGFNGKAILRVLVANFFEVIRGLVVVSNACVKVPNRVQDGQVLGILLNYLLVFRNRVGQLALLDELLRLREYLYFVETKPECHKKSIDPKGSLSKCRGKRAQVYLGLKYHRKTAKPKPQGAIVSACRLFTLKVQPRSCNSARSREI